MQDVAKSLSTPADAAAAMGGAAWELLRRPRLLAALDRGQRRGTLPDDAVASIIAIFRERSAAVGLPSSATLCLLSAFDN